MLRTQVYPQLLQYVGNVCRLAVTRRRAERRGRLVAVELLENVLAATRVVGIGQPISRPPQGAGSRQETHCQVLFLPLLGQLVCRVKLAYLLGHARGIVGPIYDVELAYLLGQVRLLQAMRDIELAYLLGNGLAKLRLEPIKLLLGSVRLCCQPPRVVESAARATASTPPAATTIGRLEGIPLSDRGWQTAILLHELGTQRVGSRIP